MFKATLNFKGKALATYDAYLDGNHCIVESDEYFIDDADGEEFNECVECPLYEWLGSSPDAVGVFGEHSKTESPLNIEFDGISFKFA